MIRYSAAVFTLLLISACSGTGPHTPELVATSDAVANETAMAPENGEVSGVGVLQESNLDESGWNCRREKTIGSNMRKKVCGPLRGNDADAENAQSALELNAIRMDDSNKVSE